MLRFKSHHYFKKKSFLLLQDASKIQENEESIEEVEYEVESEIETETENQGSKYNLRNREDMKKPKRLDDYVMLAESSMNDIKEPEPYKEAMNDHYKEDKM